MRQIFCSLLCAVFCLFPACVFAGSVVPFAGTIDLKQQKITMQFGRKPDSYLAFDARQAAPDTFTFNLDVRDLPVSSLSITTAVDGRIKFSGDRMQGDLSSSMTLVNRRPVSDAAVKFLVHNRKLTLKSFTAGALSGQGEVALSGEHDSNLSFELLSCDIEEMMTMFRPDLPSMLKGMVAGEVAASGPLMQPQIQGRIGLYNGSFKSQDFETMLLEFEGTFPKMRLVDSLISQEDGFSFRVTGPVDLSDTARLSTQVRQLTKVPIIEQEADKREWVFKRQQSKRDLVTEMKYLWLKDDRGDAQGMLGFEKKIGF